MPEARPTPRRRAAQSRSRVTVQKILDAATDLIVERGAQAVTMSEIAKRADLVIGSLYQYFTDKSAIFRAILIRHQAEARTLLHHYISEAQTLDELREALTRCFDAYFEILQKDRLIIGLWAMVQTDPELHTLDLEDTLQNARYIASVATPMMPGADLDRLVAAFMMLIQFALYAGRLARDTPPQIAAQIPSTYKAMFEECFVALNQPSTI